jgi:hypothetical protein
LIHERFANGISEVGAMSNRRNVSNRKVRLTAPKTTRRSAKGKNGRSLAERLAPFIGQAKDLPPDMSLHIDHYLYGLPKRK